MDKDTLKLQEEKQELLATIKNLKQAFYVFGTRKALLKAFEEAKLVVDKIEGKKSPSQEEIGQMLKATYR